MNALICLAEGFEEVEAITPIDILRRAEIDVTVAGVGSEVVMSAHNIPITADKKIEDCNESYDIIVLPGGMPGAANLSKDFEVIRRVINTAQTGWVCAICAAPAVVLGNTGILEGKDAVCYPGMEAAAPNIKFLKDERCVVSDNVITAQGPGVATEFALKIVECAISKDKSEELAKGFLAKI